MTSIDADTGTGELLFQVAVDLAFLSGRVALLEHLALAPTRELRNELRDSLDDRDIHPERDER